MRSDKEICQILEAAAELQRKERIKAAIEKRDAHVVVEKKPEPPMQWMVGTND